MSRRDFLKQRGILSGGAPQIQSVNRAAGSSVAAKMSVTNEAPSSAGYASGSPDNFEIHKLIRGAQVPNKRFNLMKFREGSAVKFKSLIEPVTMGQEEPDEDEILQEAYPDKGKGAEYGRLEREKARSLKYIPRKPKLKSTPPYHFQDQGSEDKPKTHLTGELQKNLKGKYYILEDIGSGAWAIRPVDDFWEFRKYRVDKKISLEKAEELMNRPKPKVDKFFKKPLRQESEKEAYAREIEKSLKIRDGGPDSGDESTNIKPKKEKVRRLATTRKVAADADADDEDVDNADEDFYAPDSDSELGATYGGASGGVIKVSDGNLAIETAEAESDGDESESELEEIGVRKYQKGAKEDDLYDEEDLDDVDEEEDDDDGDDIDVDDIDSPGKNEANGDKPDLEAGGGEAHAVQLPQGKTETETKTTKTKTKDRSKTVRPREDETTDTPPTKRVKITMNEPAKTVPMDGHLSSTAKENIKNDVVKYLERARAKGLTSKELLKHIKKKEYYKCQKEQTSKEIAALLGKICVQKKIDGEERYIMKKYYAKKNKF